ncbi:MAG: VTT domain-containing protein [Minisyncoccia bacterium]
MLDFFGLPLPELIQTAGYIGIFGIAFAESGLPFGFIFPGDSLLFTSGFFASAGLLNIWILVPTIVSAAILGDTVGYWIGATWGIKLFSKPDSFFFNPKHLARTELFYAKYGVKAVIIARFVPIVRSFVPIFAGIGSMRYRTFLRNNIIGGILWGAGITLLGYVLGAAIPGSEHYLFPATIGIICISLLPIGIEILLAWWRKNKILHS